MLLTQFPLTSTIYSTNVTSEVGVAKMLEDSSNYDVKETNTFGRLTNN